MYKLNAFLVMLLTLNVNPGLLSAAPGNVSVEEHCNALGRADFTDVQDAPTQITESKLIPQTASAPAYCKVQGYVIPQVGFEIRLPAMTWNGKFVEVGCGGPCGAVNIDACHSPLRKSYACIATDMGHKGSGTLWAYDNLQAQVDFGFRATHVGALAGKAIAERYYNRGPSKSYFVGCSTGGREGLIEAQRFPWDFDGIVAGAPPLQLAAMTQIWMTLAVQDNSGRSVLYPRDAKLLHDEVLAQCDMDDGVKDGIVGNPLACHFDPSVLACKAGETSRCLTPVQVAAVRKLYSGPVTSAGINNVYAGSGGEVPGSELEWAPTYFSAQGEPGFLYPGIVEYFRYMIFLPTPGRRWSSKNVNFDRDYKRLGFFQSLESAANPDLRQFHRAGGKLLLYQGWNDTLEAPREAIDYYETVERVIGGRELTQEFFRLFMIPGMGHCAGGEGAGEIDYLKYLEEWVEENRPPDALIGAHLDADEFMRTHDWKSANFPEEWDRFRKDPGNVRFTRPVYPYPLRAKYTGRGDSKDARSFVPDSR